MSTETEKTKEFWAEKDKEVKENLEDPPAEEEEVQDPSVNEEEELPEEDDPEEAPSEEIPNEEEELSEEDYFLATETTSYKDKEAAAKGIVEKDTTIERLKSELLLAKAQPGVASPQPQPVEQRRTREEYEEYLEGIGETQGDTAKYIQLVSDVVDVRLAEREEERQHKVLEFGRYSAEIKTKYGNTVSDSEIKDMYDVVVQVREGKRNPVELLLVQKARKQAIVRQDKTNAANKKLLHTKTKRAANLIRLKPEQAEPSKHVPNAKLQGNLEKAKQDKNVGDFLDAAFELNKPKGTGKRSL